jgi:hypothetical protein
LFLFLEDRKYELLFGNLEQLPDSLKVERLDAVSYSISPEGTDARQASVKIIPSQHSSLCVRASLLWSEDLDDSADEGSSTSDRPANELLQRFGADWMRNLKFLEDRIRGIVRRLSDA